MTIQSLRSKIFLLLTITLLAIAAFIIPVTRHEVTKTLTNTEHHATENAMTLAERNLNSSWNTSMDDKIRMVRNERAYLMETGKLIFSVLHDTARHVTGGSDTQRAQRMSANWINHLTADPSRHFFAYDAQFKIRASNRPEWIGQDISSLKDFKGQPLAQTMYDESRRFNYGFAMYRAGDKIDEPVRTHHTYYGYFDYFKDWDWVIVTARDERSITEQIAAQKTQMENEQKETLGSMQLARSGFMFILADDDHFVVPPPGGVRSKFMDEAFFKRLHERAASDHLDKEDEYEEKNFDADARFSFKTQVDSEQWHVDYSYFQPLGWTLAAMVPDRDLALPAERLIERQMIALGVLLLCAWIAASFVIARIAAPITLLARFVRHLPEQDWTAKDNQVPTAITTLPQRCHDEIGHLAEAFLLMNDKLHKNIAQLMNETSRRSRMESELSIAHDIQLGLLPYPLDTIAHQYVDVAASMTPSKEVGGDLYDYFLLPDHKTLCFVVGDVSGKGVPAALFMAITRTLVRATAEVETDPGRLLEAVNNRISANNPNLMFVTLLVGMLNIETGAFIWANAGHPPPYSISAAGRAELLPGRSGPACGVMENVRYCTFTHCFSTGETLFGYTDGVTEALDTGGAQYGDARLRAVLTQTEAQEVALMISHLGADINAFAVDAEQFDDITMLAVRFLAKHGAMRRTPG
jgi:sigma-B regulation protein RsbU (phosphoserine phosphatase)